MTRFCPACSSEQIMAIHRARNVPAHSCLLLRDQQQARDFPTGDIELSLCKSCGFLFNSAFDASLIHYSTDFEESQAFSGVFVEFARELAERWVRDHDLKGKSAIEIGCGKGDFLVWMVEAGLASGVGLDPGVQPDRFEPGGPADRIEWKVGAFTSEYGPFEHDAVVCRHTLEHIAPVETFMKDIRRSVGERKDVAVLFELPDVTRILEEGAFWDVYYEHCSYFSPGSLARLFRRTGFDVLTVERCFDDQYLIIEARPTDEPTTETLTIEEDPEEMIALAERYGRTVEQALKTWQRRMDTAVKQGEQVVIWGAGSKGVAFLQGVGSAAVVAAVDINPFKHSTFIAGSGCPVVPPEWLTANQVDLIVVMNPIYLTEIADQVNDLGLLDVEICSV